MFPNLPATLTFSAQALKKIGFKSKDTKKQFCP